MVLNILLFIGGLALVLLGANWLTDGASAVARRFNINELVIGLTIVAIGTSLPEFVISMGAALKGSSGISLGNVVGSNIFNILFVVGTSALILPVVFAPNFIIDTMIAIAAGLVLWVCVFKNKKLTRAGGSFMLLCYVVYFIYLLLQ